MLNLLSRTRRQFVMGLASVTVALTCVLGAPSIALADEDVIRFGVGLFQPDK
jgi:hypothetical protein